jgi:hypothetical protein
MGIITIQVSSAKSLPPSGLGDIEITIDKDIVRTLTADDFTFATDSSDFDFSQNLLNSVAIFNSNSSFVMYSGSQVSDGQVVSRADIDSNLLTIEPGGQVFSDSFYFNVSDASSLEFSDENTNFTVNSVDKSTPSNNLPSIGSGVADIDIGTNYTFTRDDFTTSLTPAYIDPDGDTAKRLRVESLPTSGYLRLNGINVVELEEILFSDIDLGLFKYFAPEVGSDFSNSGFEFSVSDTLTGDNFVE